ncbi:hypothetical protein [Hoyosella altamirensis]|uniref:Uncharacterized protein n=1 Tax=Hoyosella altamirensis TaxID=616997 RepID=A0A839RMU2_9ACTN|nr:hypothetical protein [Hoyosella altamirensis]MBB3037474.1 hypothetical protein [Hoyosella altamirensis]
MGRPLAALICGLLLIVGSVASWFRGVESRVEDLSDLGLSPQTVTWYSGPWLTAAAVLAAAGGVLLVWCVRDFASRRHRQR